MHTFYSRCNLSNITDTDFAYQQTKLNSFDLFCILENISMMNMNIKETITCSDDDDGHDVDDSPALFDSFYQSECPEPYQWDKYKYLFLQYQLHQNVFRHIKNHVLIKKGISQLQFHHGVTFIVQNIYKTCAQLFNQQNYIILKELLYHLCDLHAKVLRFNDVTHYEKQLQLSHFDLAELAEWNTNCCVHIARCIEKTIKTSEIIKVVMTEEGTIDMFLVWNGNTYFQFPNDTTIITKMIVPIITTIQHIVTKAFQDCKKLNEVFKHKTGGYNHTCARIVYSNLYSFFNSGDPAYTVSKEQLNQNPYIFIDSTSQAYSRLLSTKTCRQAIPIKGQPRHLIFVTLSIPYDPFKPLYPELYNLLEAMSNQNAHMMLYLLRIASNMLFTTKSKYMLVMMSPQKNSGKSAWATLMMNLKKEGILALSSQGIARDNKTSHQSYLNQLLANHATGAIIQDFANTQKSPIDSDILKDLVGEECISLRGMRQAAQTYNIKMQLVLQTNCQFLYFTNTDESVRDSIKVHHIRSAFTKDLHLINNNQNGNVVYYKMNARFKSEIIKSPNYLQSWLAMIIRASLSIAIDDNWMTQEIPETIQNYDVTQFVRNTTRFSLHSVNKCVSNCLETEFVHYQTPHTYSISEIKSFILDHAFPQLAFENDLTDLQSNCSYVIEHYVATKFKPTYSSLNNCPKYFVLHSISCWKSLYFS